MTKVVRVGLINLLFCCVAVGTALSQVKSSAITGSVTDSSGASIAGAGVTITDTDTGVSTSTKSQKDGTYTAPYLQEGKYSVQVEAPGFKTFRAEGFQLGAGLTLRVNAVLSVGAATQTVHVNASAAQLQTESATVQAAVNAETIMNIPNITDNPLYYATLQAGVLPTPAMANTRALGVGYQDRISYSSINVNGGAVGTGDVQLDGLSIQGSAWHESTVLPNRDSLQEVRVSTNDLSADLGGGQGVVSLVTKSGTNQFHGDLYYFMRNEAFNANGLSNDLRGIPRGKYRVNQGGGAIGGPVIIPHLFNGTDKVFFFASYSRLTHVQPANGFLTVPTALQRTGDFGSTLTRDQNGNPIPAQIYNPFSAVPINPTTVQRPEYPQGTCDPGFLSTYGRCGDKVTNPDPAGLKLLSAYPMPNHAPSDLFGDNNYYYSGTSPTTRNNLSARLDFHFGKHSIYATGGWDNGSALAYNANGKGPWINLIGGPDFTDSNPYAAVGDTITLSPTALLDVRMGVTRINTSTGVPNATTFTSSDYSSYGMPAAVQQYIDKSGSAPIVGPWTDICCGNSPLNFDGYAGKKEHQTNVQFAGSVTKLLGKWTLKNGAEYRVYLGNWQDLIYGTPALAGFGQDNYNEQYANLDGTNSSLNTTAQQRGYGGAFLAVGVAGYEFPPANSSKLALAAKYLAFYSQNDWKVTTRLTLNLGLRYEIQPAQTERHNRLSDVDLTAADPFADPFAGANPLAGLGAVAFMGKGGYSRHLWETQYNNIAPRLGVAYQLSDSTVVRGGWGRVYVPSNTGFNANGAIYGQAPFAGGTAPRPFGPTPNGLPVGRMEDAQSTQYFPAPGAAQSPLLYGDANGAAGVDYFEYNGFKNGYVDQWNVAAERRFGGWLASMAYVGSRGRDLPWRGYEINGQFDIPWSTLMDWQNQWIASSGNVNPGANRVPNPFPALAGQAYGDIGGNTVPYIETLEPYLGLLGTTLYTSKGSSLYNSMQLRAEHPYANGLSTLFTYTWSKSTGVTGGTNGSTYSQGQASGGINGNYGPGTGGVDYRNPNNNGGLLSYDLPQRFVAAITYELPFGTGKRFDPQNRVAQTIVGGWQLSPVVTLQSGEPWGPSCGSENGRCIPTGQPLELPKSYQHWYDGNTSVTLPDGRVVTPPQYTYLKWNPDAYGARIVQWADGTSHVAEYWLGTTPLEIGSLRTPAYQNVNLALSKSIQIKERLNLQLLAEATNLFNHTNFYPGAPNNQFNNPIVQIPTGNPSNVQIGQNGNPSAGTLSTAVYDPRQLTLTLRLKF